jgi:HAD superfamily hydrolase (TIGR01549 family)
MSSKNKIIVFDFDGVIVNTFALCYEIRNAHYPLSQDSYREKFEGNINDSIKKVKQPILNFFEQYTPSLMKCGPIEGMPDLIKKLSEKYNLIIVSSTISSSIKSFLESFNLDIYFKEILGNDIEHSKVKKLQMVLEKYQVSSKDVIFITDTLGDIKEGKVCNIESIAVTWGYHPAETLAKGNPYSIVSDPKELSEKIEEYFK